MILCCFSVYFQLHISAYLRYILFFFSNHQVIYLFWMINQSASFHVDTQKCSLSVDDSLMKNFFIFSKNLLTHMNFTYEWVFSVMYPCINTVDTDQIQPTYFFLTTPTCPSQFLVSTSPLSGPLFQLLHMSKNTWYLSFCVQFISLIVSSSAIHFAVNDRISVFFMFELYSIVYISHI